jgi:hypothetical protein
MSDDQGRPVAPHRSGGWHWVGPTREEAPSMSELIANVTANFYHTDHPLRHWDRTCPACQQETAPADGLPEPPRIEGVAGVLFVTAADYDALRARLQEEIAKHTALQSEVADWLVREPHAALRVMRERAEAAESRVAALQKELEAVRKALRRLIDLDGNCDYVDGEPLRCPGIDRNGTMCHWCEGRAALSKESK